MSPVPPHQSITYLVDLGPEGPNPRSFHSISILLHANASLIALQSSSTSLCSFLTQTPFVCTLVPCSHPHPFQPHVDSCPSYRCSPVSVPIAYVVSISSSLAELYFPSSIIISLIPIEHCSEDYLTSICSFDEVSDVGTLLET